jgi:hypothetical protein
MCRSTPYGLVCDTLQEVVSDLEAKKDSVERINDSLKAVCDSLHNVVSDNITIGMLEKTQEFYSSSFQQIQNSYMFFLSMIAIIFAIASIIASVIVGREWLNNQKDKKYFKKMKEDFEKMNNSLLNFTSAEQNVPKPSNIGTSIAPETAMSNPESLNANTSIAPKAAMNNLEPLNTNASNAQETAMNNEVSNASDSIEIISKLEKRIAKLEEDKMRTFLRNNQYFSIVLGKCDYKTIEVFEKFEKKEGVKKMIPYLDEFYKRMSNPQFFEWWLSLDLQQKENGFQAIMNQVNSEWGKFYMGMSKKDRLELLSDIISKITSISDKISDIKEGIIRENIRDKKLFEFLYELCKEDNKIKDFNSYTEEQKYYLYRNLGTAEMAYNKDFGNSYNLLLALVSSCIGLEKGRG